MLGKDNISWTPASRNYHSIIIQTMIFTKEIIDFNNLSKNKISLQYHKKRSEHWVVVEGKASVTKGDQRFDLKKTNQHL